MVKEKDIELLLEKIIDKKLMTYVKTITEVEEDVNSLNMNIIEVKALVVTCQTQIAHCQSQILRNEKAIQATKDTIRKRVYRNRSTSINKEYANAEFEK